MPTEVWLSPGDGNVSGALALDSGAYTFLDATLNAPPPEDGARTRPIEFRLDVRGPTSNDMWLAYRALEALLNQAVVASGPYGTPPPVTFGIRLKDATELIVFDILSGTLTVPEDAIAGPRIESDVLRDVLVSLVCLPFGRGQPHLCENRVTAPVAFDNAAWLKTRATFTPDAMTAPDGSVTADKMIEDGAINTHHMRQEIVTEIGVTYTASCYVKAAERTEVRLAFTDGAGATIAQISVDLTTGVTVTSTGTVRVLPLADGWYRLSASGVATGIESELWIIMMLAGATVYDGNGVFGLFLWGAQLAAAVSLSPLMLPAGTTTAITHGDGGWLYLFDVPGDVDALCAWTLTDQSTGGKFINRVRIGRRSLPALSRLSSTGYDAIIDAVASGSATETIDATAVGGSYAELLTTPFWQTVATLTRPAGAPATNGLLDLIARVNDPVTAIDNPLIGSIATLNDGYSYRADGKQSTGVPAATTRSPSWSQETLRGSLLVMFVGLRDDQVITVPGDWTPGPIVAHAGGDAKVAIYYIVNAAPRSGTELVSIPIAAHFAVQVVEFVGVGFVTPADVSVTNTATATSLTLTTGALAQAHEVVIACVMPGSSDITSVSGTVTGESAIYEASSGLVTARAFTTVATSQTVVFSANASGALAGALMTFKKQTNAAPAMPPGVYTFQTVPYNAAGAHGIPSNQRAFQSFPLNTGLYVPWDEPIAPGVDHYRVFFKRDALDWKYFETAAGVAPEHYVLTTETGATVDDPPLASTERTQWRARVALASGDSWFYGPATTGTLLNGIWELVYLGALPCPPVPAPDGDDPVAWRVEVQHLNPEGSVAAKVDAGWFLPHDEPQIVDAHVAGLSLTTLSDWAIETRRDGRTFGRLFDPATGAVVDALDVLGESTIGPGSDLIVFVLDITDGVNDVINARITPRAVITPRYRFLTGWA